HYDFAPRDKQREVFEKQIAIAVERNLPIVVHTRESTEESIETVERFCVKHPHWRNNGSGEVKGARGVFHCFTGTADQARKLFALGFHVSFPGIVTFKNSPVLETLKSIGHESILLETDSPFLTPSPFRGKRNEPAYIPYIANKIAEVLNTTPGVVAGQTTANAKRLFSLDSNA
ncbi:MAG TPA: TatD family hydrolase, partial [Bacteroidota bacterium]